MGNGVVYTYGMVAFSNNGPCYKGQAMRSSSGFTLMELMVVVVIVGIMSSYGIASFTKKLENDRVRKAIENLKVIYNMEKRYKLENGEYFPKKTGGSCVQGTIALINAGLGLYMRDPNFSYIVTGTCAGATTTAYNAFAVRTSGQCKDKTIKLTEAGGEPVVTGCTLWQ